MDESEMVARDFLRERGVVLDITERRSYAQIATFLQLIPVPTHIETEQDIVIVD